MIHLNAETTNDDPWSFVGNLSNIVEKIRWSDDETVKQTAGENSREFVEAPRNETFRKNPYAYMKPVGITEATSEPGPVEKKTSPVNSNPNNTVKSYKNDIATEPEREEEVLVPESLEGVISDDYIEYSSIGFYANAAVIHPSYKAEMISLAAHLKEETTLKLIIHGHCNGDTPRTIIAPGLLTRFFEIDGYHEQKTASAKEFSEMRAEYAKRFLVSQGICEDRIQIIGKGGEMMIYPAASENARYNDRVEFELIKASEETPRRSGPRYTGSMD